MQDAGPFGAQLFGEQRVAIGRHDRHVERHKMKPAPDRLVDTAQSRLVVAGDDELKGRPECEKILPHEPGGDWVAAGQRLDLVFGPMSAFLGFLARNEPGAA